MTAEVETVRIVGLDELDELELREALTPEDLKIEKATTEREPGQVHPEPMTVIAVVVLTSAALKGLTAWLLKKRHRSEIELTVERTAPDGTKERKVVKLTISESASEADVVRQVGDLFGADVQVVAEAAAGASSTL